MSSRTLSEVLSASTELADIAIEGTVELLQHAAIEDHDRLEVMLALTRRKPAAVFWPVFHATWQTCDDTFRIRNRLLKLLSARDAESRSTDYLAKDARRYFELLPNPFTAYRGCSKARVTGLSWTTGEAAAQEFARRDLLARQKPSLVTASVPKSAVFGVYVSGEDANLIINPRRARLNVRPLAEIKTPRSAPYAEWEQLVERVRLERAEDLGTEDVASTYVPASRGSWLRKLMQY